MDVTAPGGWESIANEVLRAKTERTEQSRPLSNHAPVFSTEVVSISPVSVHLEILNKSVPGTGDSRARKGQLLRERPQR